MLSKKVKCTTSVISGTSALDKPSKQRYSASPTAVSGALTCKGAVFGLKKEDIGLCPVSGASFRFA